MHLKSISIKGFKSFPDRMNLVFSPGVSVIVGPNGCGKSNITDAVLWALGEQSPTTVRGSTMQDVIYNGGAGQKPRREAEVEVVLDATGSAAAEQFAEISIRRTLDRDGHGSYHLNGARCRLADVIETLADANLGGDMHSVIGQGKVESIVLSKPRERRLLVEEAAGLGKHRKRRRRAELKLAKTRDNLDRALDVEREATARLRPLRAQAQAAETHARLQRQADELMVRLLRSELASQGDRVELAELAVSEARVGRDGLDLKLAEVAAERSVGEEQLASRDRERTAVWERLTAIRGATERLSVRAESLAGAEAELRSALASREATLGSLAAEAARARGQGADDPVAMELRAASQELAAAGKALHEAVTAELDGARVDPVGRMREHAERAARAGRRAEELLGRRRQDSLAERVARERQVLELISRVAAATASARDGASRHTAGLERTVVGRQEGDELTRALRSLSAREAEIQVALRGASERLTTAEVSAAQLRDRRDESRAELARVEARLELEPLEASSGSVLDQPERAEIERKLARLARRREQLGPVNPLAGRQYEEALAEVEELKAQREDIELALAELEKLIRDTDREIRTLFEQTFDAAQDNFSELIEHLFPGGRGRLRLLEPTPKLVPVPMATAPDSDAPAAAPAAATEADEADPDEPGDDGAGIEIEVTPAGKASRRLSLLSGGEKSLVALAFVFSVFLARPSPFYILDEVEAALDDANIDRFLQLVRRFSDRAQFVVVTHQKRTMDAADVLYGVTMGSGGISKVISRRLPRSEQDPLEPTAAA